MERSLHHLNVHSSVLFSPIAHVGSVCFVKQWHVSCCFLSLIGALSDCQFAQCSLKLDLFFNYQWQHSTEPRTLLLMSMLLESG